MMSITHGHLNFTAISTTSHSHVSCNGISANGKPHIKQWSLNLSPTLHSSWFVDVYFSTSAWSNHRKAHPRHLTFRLSEPMAVLRSSNIPTLLSGIPRVSRARLLTGHVTVLP